jgi:hypothetical protein
MGMTLLAYLLAAMLAVSGALKARSGARLGIGLVPGALIELMAGVAVAAVPLMGRALPVWLIVAAVSLVIASSAHYGLVLRRIRQRREASEGGRLAAYVKYLSRSDGDGPQD